METLFLPLTKPVEQNPCEVGKKIDDKTLNFLINHVNLKDRNKTLILNTHQQEDLHQQVSLNQLLGSDHQNIVNLKRINDIRRINKFLMKGYQNP